jgi:hypothetical protein
VPNGYTYRGYSCHDTDECLDGKHTCTVNQVCANINYGKGYECLGPPDPALNCAVGSQGKDHYFSLKLTYPLTHESFGDEIKHRLMFMAYNISKFQFCFNLFQATNYSET